MLIEREPPCSLRHSKGTRAPQQSGTLYIMHPIPL